MCVVKPLVADIIQGLAGFSQTIKKNKQRSSIHNIGRINYATIHDLS
jgi:hypothetical protein